MKGVRRLRAVPQLIALILIFVAAAATAQDMTVEWKARASCATCHKQELAFTDGRAVGVGATGESHSRNAMSLVNIAYSGVLTWSNPRMRLLEEQALVPMFGEHPVEPRITRKRWIPADTTFRFKIPPTILSSVSK